MILLCMLTLSPLGAYAGMSPEEVRVFNDYKSLAEAGSVSAQFRLGICYATGSGVAKDETEAARLYRLAAEQGHLDAQYNLGASARGED
jgi:TPR repeat protein